MKELSIKSYSSITVIEDAIFDTLGNAQSFYFSKLFLTAFEQANTHINYQYILFFKGLEPVALGILQHFKVALDGAIDNLPLSAKIARSVQSYLNNRKSRVTVCGNIFLSGPYGLCVKEGYDPRKVWSTLSRKLKTLQTTNTSSIYFLKDFNAVQDAAASVAEQFQFQSFMMEPNMRLRIEWENFESYKAQLKSKYRVKINKADATSAPLRLKTLSVEDILEHLELLQSLYTNITEAASFNAVDLKIETYVHLKKSFPDKVIFNSYWLDETIVGFATAFLVADRLDAHFIGMDYELNKRYALYPRMLNDYVRMGIDFGVQEVNLGRTASEIKSTLGARPEHLRCYVKHKRSMANMLFKPLVRQIKMTEFKQHTPFKSLGK